MARRDCLFLACWLVLPALAPAQAVTGVEYRDFSISVDGRESGLSQLTISTQDDGMVMVTGKASVVVNKLIVKVTYDVQATEWWKNGLLAGFKARVNDNGKVTELQASLDRVDTLHLRIGNSERVLRRETWINSFWKLPDPRFFNKQVPVLDGDSGKDFMSTLQFVAEEKVNVGNQPWKCYHFRVTGGPCVEDLWFDESHRLVRREFDEQRSHIVIQLTGIRR
jgi:hypothetical protein